MTLINIGFGNMVSAERVIAMVSPESAPIKRMIQDARDRGLLIDASFGRSTKSVIIMDSGNVVMQGNPKEIFSQVDTLKKYGLDVPQVTLLAYELKKSGVDVPDGILTTEELVSALCQLN